MGASALCTSDTTAGRAVRPTSPCCCRRHGLQKKNPFPPKVFPDLISDVSGLMDVTMTAADAAKHPLEVENGFPPCTFHFNALQH